MATGHPIHLDRAAGEAVELRHALARARHGFYEDCVEALRTAARGYELGRAVGDASLCARSRALSASVSLHRGDLTGALELVVEAERHLEGCADLAAQSEVLAVKAQVSFFTGSYAEALSHAEAAVAAADRSEELSLRVFARRGTCLVFGNVGVPDWPARLEEMLRLAVDLGDPWEEAISRNDLAHYRQSLGDAAGAEAEIASAVGLAAGLGEGGRFALGVVLSTRADVRLVAGRPAEALEDAERAIALLSAGGDPNPYVLGATVRAQVQARMALGRLDDARRAGEGALAALGDRVPQTRSLILSTLASELRAAGHVEEAYDALAQAAELERQAFRELSALQLRLERATLETRAARRQTQELREEADRDWLTGLHNRRYLARELERLGTGEPTLPLSVAVLDLDHFKEINDRFGHLVGDHVLVTIAGLLCDVLRDTDTVVRSGGEEFLVLMPATNLRAAVACCERVRSAIGAEAWDRIAPGLTVTTSAGVAAGHEAEELPALVRLADQRLYEAKRAGRDRVVGAVAGERVGDGERVVDGLDPVAAA